MLHATSIDVDRILPSDSIIAHLWTPDQWSHCRQRPPVCNDHFYFTTQVFVDIYYGTLKAVVQTDGRMGDPIVLNGIIPLL